MTSARDRQQPKSSMERTLVVLLLLLMAFVLRIGVLALATEEAMMIAVDSSPATDGMPDQGAGKMASGEGGGEGGWERIRAPGSGHRGTEEALQSDTHSRSKDFGGSPSEGRPPRKGDVDTSLPSLVNDVGEFLSYDVTRRRLRRHRQRRSIDDDDDSSPVFYRLNAFGREFRLNVSRNHRLLAPSYAVEYWGAEEGAKAAKQRRSGRRFDRECIYTGHIVHEELTSRVALTNCDGLLGVFVTEHEEYFVEPLWNDSEQAVGGGRGGKDRDQGQRHVIYRRNVTKNENYETKFDCAATEERSKGRSLIQRLEERIQSSKEKKNLLQRTRRRRKRRRKRSFSRENFVETLVVVDSLTAKYHGHEAVEAYILTVMNIVAKLFRDVSIGNDVNIVVSKIIVLLESQKDLDITHNADKSLERFCRWQHNQSRASDDSSSHHDTAILITRLDICLHQNQPCGTLGLAPVGGMCDPFRSCSIIEDIGIATAYTIAHELGHSFGMQHDGTLNPCGQPGADPARLMASQLAKNTEPFSWSSCSREYITAFLDSGKGDCLRNSPDQDQLKEKVQPLPGRVHSADVQCRYQFGLKSAQCNDNALDICRELWCLNPSNHCVTNSIPAAEGTPCSSPKVKLGWCYGGSCMRIDWRPKAVNGQWGGWSAWSTCSRSCGGGVTASERSCSNPRPEHGGRYCIGERRRYKSCNIINCPENSTDFREIQCAKFNSEPFRGQYYKWKPFMGGASGKDWKPCALTCMAVDHHFYTERAAKVVDGTRCYHDSLDMCIDGKCEHVGCDGVLGSDVAEDKCRICGGDGRHCRTIRGTFDKEVKVGGESYVEAVHIPKGAMNILVIEEKTSHNYLALKSEGPNGNYYVNGHWTIDWPRQFEVANTSVTYERPKDKPESLQLQGPTSEDLTVMVFQYNIIASLKHALAQLLMQEKNKGILFEYSLPTSKGTGATVEYEWQYGEWSDCSTTCGRGISHQKAMCVNRSNHRMIVDRGNCLSFRKYEDKMKFCNEIPCPPEWHVGNWTECSKTCGGGWKTRQISCIRKVDRRLFEDIEHGNCSSKMPMMHQKCNRKKCLPQWTFDEWSECRPECGNGSRTRNVYCVNSQGKYLQERKCDPSKKPSTIKHCQSAPCPSAFWRTGAWGECSASCGMGKQMRSIACLTHRGEESKSCDNKTLPQSIQECSSPCHHNSLPDCQDLKDAGYCQLVVKFKFCNSSHFNQICCKTCTDAG